MQYLYIKETSHSKRTLLNIERGRRLIISVINISIIIRIYYYFLNTFFNLIKKNENSYLYDIFNDSVKRKTIL